MKKDTLTYSFLALREKLHRSALRFLRDDEDARDALQDTFVNLWNSGPVETDAEARNKLFAVLRNVCIDRLRKARTEPISPGDAERIEAPPDSFEDIPRLESLITAGLTPVQKMIYQSVARDGMDYEDIAQTMNMTVEAVRMNMSRARKKIRENYLKLNR